LKALPKSLDETYDRILLSIDPDFHEYASTALQWLVFAKRPLFLSELAEAAVIRPEATVPFDIENRFQSADDILHVLSGLVVTQIKGTLTYNDDFYAPGYDDDTSPIVRLAHFSVKEYLTSSRILRGPAKIFRLDESLSSRTILESCLSYFEKYACTGTEPFEEYDLDDFPLLSYSCEYWPIHASSPLKPSTINLLSKCLSTKRWLVSWMTATNTWRGTFEEWVDYEGDYWSSFDALLEDDKAVLNVALYIVSYFGLKTMLEPLIKLGADPNRSIQVADEFPIIAATSEGEYQIVQELIEIGADIALINRNRETALHKAVSRKNSKIAHLLLENGFDVNMGAEGLENPGNTPLITAICKGGPSMIQMLLENGAVVNILAVCKLLISRSRLDEESRSLILEFSHVSDQNREELLEFLLRVNKILTKRLDDIYNKMALGPGFAVHQWVY
jgi:ankyrin repeat domain-containing protein 50